MVMTMEARLRRLLEAVEILNRRGQPMFQDRVLQACRHLFPESFSGFQLWDRLTGIHTGGTDVPYDENSLLERFQRVGELVPLQHPGYPLIIAGEKEVLRLSDLTTQREFAKTELFDVGFKPVDLRHQVALPILTPQHLGGVTVNKGGSQDFSAEDLELLGIFSRHLVLALQNEMILLEAQKQQPQVAMLDHLTLRRAGLTKRESEVFVWMAEGKRDREIATILGVSYRTVTNHVYSILRKLGVETRTAAVSALCER